MPFRIPDHQFHEDHLGDGSQPPAGIVKVRFRCRPSFCQGTMTAELVEADTGVVLTGSGEVRCTGQYELHQLDLTVARPLQETEVRPRYHCGSETKDGDPLRIWIRSS
jgi:hypothetical protein